jgi:Zn-dependent peptidase ImmA (M78 family)
VLKIRHYAKPQNVTGHAKRRHDKHNRTVKRQTKCQPFAKLKELQADTQANAFAAHLILPNRSQANLPPDQWTVDIWAATFDNNRVIKINFTSYLDELNLN